MIESYSFGQMVVDGKEYHDDLLICEGEVKSGWVRKRGHQLQPEDLNWVVDRNPDLLVVGTGRSGRMKVPEETKSFLGENRIALWVGDTADAKDYFNARRKEKDGEKIAGAFHLTC